MERLPTSLQENLREAFSDAVKWSGQELIYTHCQGMGSRLNVYIGAVEQSVDDLERPVCSVRKYQRVVP